MSPKNKESNPDNQTKTDDNTHLPATITLPAWVPFAVVVCFIGLLLVPTVILPAMDRKGDAEPKTKSSLVTIDEFAAKEGYLAPAFSLTDTAGNTVKLADYKGSKGVVLVFEATWCGYCRKELQNLETAHTKFSDSVAIFSITSEDLATVEKYLTEQGIARPWLLDNAQKVISDYQAFSTPTHYFINKDGYIEDIVKGYIDQTELDRYIQQII
ncbi:MAG TPA: TlpA disulfide reductase family protein [bacterium]|nr:TlpA disulfide reductase family protein [bacterium]